MDYKLQIFGVKPHLQMGSLDDSSIHQPDNESLFTMDEDVKGTKSVNMVEKGSFSVSSPVGDRNMIRNGVCKSIKTVIFSNKLNLLMPFGPLAILVQNLSGHNGWVFLLSLMGIAPLAERLGYITEQLAFYTGPTVWNGLLYFEAIAVGGLLNATFGNATELIVSIYALKSGMIHVVQRSLLGSILSNMLLVLGCSFFFGGLVLKQQAFTKATAIVNAGLLLMAVMALLFPAVLHNTHTEVHFGKSELALSRFSSCVMLLAYAVSLVFQLKTQKDLYVPLNEEENKNGNSNDPIEGPEVSKCEAFIWLAIITICTAVLSDYLVDAMEGASVAWNMPMAFVSTILPPIGGNAAALTSCIMFAMKDKLDMSLGVAIGSSTQISMFVLPFCVLIGWIIGSPMDLNFQLFETAALFITIIVVAIFLLEGTSNYFKGLMLILCYLIVAASFYMHRDSADDKEMTT